MSGMENFLPESYQFNTAVTDVREPLVDELYELAEELGDVIDPQAEFSRSYEGFWALSKMLTQMYRSDTEDEKQVQAVMYRAMNFGIQVVNNISSGKIEKISMKYWDDDSVNEENRAIVMQADVQEYLAQRPAINSLIFSFMPEIDDTYLYNHHAEMAAGLMFMICENEQAEHYLKAQAEGLSPDSL